jgi:nanoRNase/pAp phosphatase (c-di-AMP/oligoRNAs hydrolase)
VNFAVHYDADFDAEGCWLKMTAVADAYQTRPQLLTHPPSTIKQKTPGS